MYKRLSMDIQPMHDMLPFEEPPVTHSNSVPTLEPLSPPMNSRFSTAASVILASAEQLGFLCESSAGNLQEDDIDQIRLNLDSLDAAELAGVLSRQFNFAVSPATVLSYPIIGDLARRIIGERSYGLPSAIRVLHHPARDVPTKVSILSASCRLPVNSTSMASCWSLHSFWRDVILAKNDAVVCPEIGALLSKDTDCSSCSEPHADHHGFGPDSFGAFLPGFDLDTVEASSVSRGKHVVEADPHHKIMLTVAGEALHCWLPFLKVKQNHNVGVFIGCCSSVEIDSAATSAEDDITLSKCQIDGSTRKSIPSFSSRSVITKAPSMIANTVSWSYNLTGPSMVIDTACSSSLVAMDTAIKHLHECPHMMAALVGGVNLMLSRRLSVALSKAGALSQIGGCKTFSNEADGYGRGEACAAVLLTRLDDHTINAQRGDDTTCLEELGDQPSSSISLPLSASLEAQPQRRNSCHAVLDQSDGCRCQPPEDSTTGVTEWGVNTEGYEQTECNEPINNRQTIEGPRANGDHQQVEDHRTNEGHRVTKLSQTNQENSLASRCPVKPLAVILATSVNQGGRTAMPTAPCAKAQLAAVEKCLTAGNVAPRDLSYVECHGSGTPLGDPIEVNALRELFGSLVLPRQASSVSNAAEYQD